MTSSPAHAVTADRVFDGERFHDHCAVLLQDSQIAALTGRHEIPGEMPVVHLPPGAILAPGFIDVQVNGGGDVLFNEQPTADAAIAIARAHRRFGTPACLPTRITDTRETMAAAAAAIGAAMQREPAILGIHFEGPFLSPERAGVHDRALIRAPGAGDFEILTGLRSGRSVVTLAPEIVPPGFIARLAAGGIRVALGHSMASYAETRQAIADGLTGFTHLFNAMPPPAAREPGPIGAALESPGCWYGLIVDGHHVHPATLKLALRGAGQPMLVTDAMPPVSGTQAGFRLYGQEIELRDGRCTRSDGTLAGAALDMATAVRNCVRLLDVPLARALQMASSAPAAFLGVADRIGRLAPGYRADMVALDAREIRVLDTWVAGRQDH